MSVTFTSNLGVAKNASHDALMRAAEIIGGMAESYSKQICPVDTGNLRNSITHATEEKGIIVSVVIGSNVHYAPYVELGTGRLSEKSKGFGLKKGMRPRPYLRPGIEDHKEEYSAVVQSEMHKG